MTAEGQTSFFICSSGGGISACQQSPLHCCFPGLCGARLFLVKKQNKQSCSSLSLQHHLDPSLLCRFLLLCLLMDTLVCGVFLLVLFVFIGLLHSGPAFAEGGVRSPPSVSLYCSQILISGEDVSPAHYLRGLGTLGWCRRWSPEDNFHRWFLYWCKIQRPERLFFFLQAGGCGDTGSSVRIASVSVRLSAYKA